MDLYVIHFDKLIERRTFLEKQIKKQKIKLNWFIQEFEKPYSEKEINKYYFYDKKNWKKKLKIARKELIPRKLSFPEIALTINHFKLWELCVKKNKLFVIFEDDVEIQPNFKLNLKKVIKMLNKLDWDLCFFDWCDITPPKSKTLKLLKKEEDYASWGAAGYILKPETAKKLLKESKFCFVIDDELKYRCYLLDLKVLWVVPPLTRQASIYGNFKSSLEFGRERSGIKKYFFWKKYVYKSLDAIGLNIISRQILKLEQKIKKVFINIPK